MFILASQLAKTGLTLLGTTAGSFIAGYLFIEFYRVQDFEVLKCANSLYTRDKTQDKDQDNVVNITCGTISAQIFMKKVNDKNVADYVNFCDSNNVLVGTINYIDKMEPQRKNSNNEVILHTKNWYVTALLLITSSALLYTLTKVCARHSLLLKFSATALIVGPLAASVSDIVTWIQPEPPSYNNDLTAVQNVEKVFACDANKYNKIVNITFMAALVGGATALYI